MDSLIPRYFIQYVCGSAVKPNCIRDHGSRELQGFLLSGMCKHQCQCLSAKRSRLTCGTTTGYKVSGLHSVPTVFKGNAQTAGVVIAALRPEIPLCHRRDYVIVTHFNF